ncbi:hypothetical protein N2152v2_005275 [Parachlorella kessleri]
MRSRFAVLFLAVCLCGAGVRATSDSSHIENAVSGMLQNILGNLGKGPAATLASSASSVKESMLSQYSLLSKQLEQQVNTYESNWCTPGKFTPGSKKPATFVGASMELAFESGSCYFNDTKWIEEGVKELNCTEPAITYTHSPANFTSAYHKAATFTSQASPAARPSRLLWTLHCDAAASAFAYVFCQISKSFGEPVEKVLFVFDGAYTDGEIVNVQDLTSKITSEVQNMLSSMTTSIHDVRSGLFDGLNGIASANPAAGATMS